MADRPDRKHPEVPTPAKGADRVPATPGFHEAPGRGQHKPQQPSSTIPATPGFHQPPQHTETGSHARVQSPRRSKPEWREVTAGAAPQRRAAKAAPTSGQQPAARPAPHAPVQGQLQQARATHPAPKPALKSQQTAPIPPVKAVPKLQRTQTTKPQSAMKPDSLSVAKPAAAAEAKPVPKAPAKPAVKPQPVPPLKGEPKPAPKAELKPEPKVEKIKREVHDPKVPAYRPPEAAVDPERTSGPAPVAAAGVAKVDEAPQDAPKSQPKFEAKPVEDAPEPQGPRVDDQTERREDADSSRDHRDGKHKRAFDSKKSSPEKRPGIGELFSKLSDQIQALVSGEIALIKTRAQGFVKKIGVGAALLIAAAVLALYMLGVLLHAAVLGLSVVLPSWAAALVVGAILLVIILILALVGVAQVKKGLNSTPNPQDDLRKDVDAVKKGMTK